MIIILLILVILSISINEKTWYEIVFGLIKKIFFGLLIYIVSASNRTKVDKQSKMYGLTYSYQFRS